MEDEDILQHPVAGSSQCVTAGSSANLRMSSSDSSVSRQCSTSESSESKQQSTSGSSEGYLGGPSRSSGSFIISSSSIFRPLRRVTLSTTAQRNRRSIISLFKRIHDSTSSSSGSNHEATPKLSKRYQRRQSVDSSENVVVDPDGLLSILPILVWDEIIEKLVGTDDIVQLLNSSLFFRKLLIRERTVHLFSQVWNILGKRYEEDSDLVYDERSDSEISSESSQPTYGGGSSSSSNFADYKFCRFCRRRRYTRSYSGILKLRLVTKVWCKVIDNFYQKPRERLVDPKATDAPPSHDYLQHWKDDKFATLHDGAQLARDFLEHFRRSHDHMTNRSPFFGKSIFLVFQLVDGEAYRRRQNECFREVKAILEKYGGHVGECAIKILGDRSIPDQFHLIRLEYCSLRQLLNVMANLRSLYLESASTNEDFYEDEHAQRRRTQLKTYIIDRPLPELESLDYICSKSSCSLILTELLSRNNFVAKLQLVESRPFFQSGTYVIPFPCLRNLWIKITSMEDFLLLSDPEVKRSLTKLWIGFEESVVLDWSQLFEVVQNRWGRFLLELEVRLPVQTTGKIITTGKLCLPALKRLTLVAPKNASLDFILPIKDTLECLDVTVFQEFIGVPVLPAEEKRITLACNGNLGSDKIWERFPKLKLVRFTDYLPDDGGEPWQLRCFYRCDCERKSVPQLEPPRRRWQGCFCL